MGLGCKLVSSRMPSHHDLKGAQQQQNQGLDSQQRGIEKNYDWCSHYFKASLLSLTR